MSFFTTFLETVPHFENAVAQKERELKTIQPQSEERLITLVQLAYCYAHVQLQKGVAVAEEAITLAGTVNNLRMKANALCAKAMNEFRIGYVAHAQVTAELALSIFENINDEEGKSDAYFQMGAMPYISEGPGNTSLHLEKAQKAYSSLGNTTGVYLVRIQQTLQIFLAAKFEEGTREVKSLIGELEAPHQRHLLCFANMQLTISMHLRQDVIQFMNAILNWQKIAEANGNFHDYTMTKAMLTDCYRLQHINKDVMQACLESMECTEKLGSIHGHSTVSIVMASILGSQGQYQDALFYFQKAMDAARKIEDPYKYLMALNASGEIYLKSGQITKAHETFETAKREATLANDRLNLISAQRHLAELAYQQGEFDSALFDFKILFDNANNSDGWNMQDYGNYASSIAKASDEALKEAGIKPEERYTIRHQYLKKYLELAQQQQNEREEANACKALALYYEETQDLNAALKYHKEYIRLHEEIVNEQSNKNMADLRMQYETQKKEQEMILLKQESEQALLNERLRISRELHDDIGSTLGSISIYSEVAKNRNKRNKNAEQALFKIGTTSRELIDKMSDIVWSLNTNNKSFEQLQNRMTAFSAMILAPRNIVYEFIEDDEIERIQLSAEQRKNIFLIFKEAIYNIAKYATCKKVTIIVSKKNEVLKMIISDDGKGFDVNTNNSYNGNGIKNMRTRAEEMNGKLRVISGINKGTTVELDLKV